MKVVCPSVPGDGGLSTEDVGMATDAIQDDDGPQHLKQVSRIKHLIREEYLPSWECIVDSRNRRRWREGHIGGLLALWNR